MSLPVPEAITCGAAGVVAVAAAAGGWLARGSTAVPAAAWAAAAAVALAVEAGCRGSGWLRDPAALAAARLVVVALGVCPAMSVLGAKRPQHGVWQLVVAALAGVLAMPAASAALVRPGSMPDVHVIERCFLPLLVAVGWMNFVVTRHGVAATLVAAGQAALARPFLPGVPAVADPVVDALAACGIAVGGVIAATQSALRPGGRDRRRGLAAVVDPPFIALRETLGAAWTLRIVERFNAVAGARGWPCRLGFGGLEQDPGGVAGVSWERDAVRLCRSLLRRFASAAWIERHGGLRIGP